jgi:uncharacterized membrane protein
MPEIILLGWIHTFIGILALLVGFYTLAKYKVISSGYFVGRLYLWSTLITAVTSLGIYNQGGFGPAHILGVLTLLALFAGHMVTKISVLSKISVYFQAFCYSSTFLFHMIPAITDGLRRLPVGDPVVTDPEDPLLLNFYTLFIVLFLVGYALQVMWLWKQNKP